MKNSSLSDWQVRHLAIDLTKRRILSRYRGSIFGLAWAILLPLAMLAVYSLVFNHFLGVRWPGAESEGGLSAALRIYLGLIVLNFWLGTRLRQRSLFPMERMLSMSMMPRVKRS